MPEKPNQQPDEWEFEGKRYAGTYPGTIWRYNETAARWEMLIVNIRRPPEWAPP